MVKVYDTWYGNDSSASDGTDSTSSSSSGSSHSRASSPDGANAPNQFSSKCPYSRRISSEHYAELKEIDEYSSGSACSERASPASTFASSSRAATPESLTKPAKKNVVKGQGDIKRKSIINKSQVFKVLRPRWHTQSFMVLLALRQHPRHELSRMELMKAAVEMDMKMSRERGLPRVFGGKTPLNSASAVLTNNVDNHFVSFKPKGARSMRFKLAYETGNFDSALAHYNNWMTKLIDHDWPLYFGVPMRKRKDGAINGDQGEARYNAQPTNTNSRKRELAEEEDDDNDDDNENKNVELDRTLTLAASGLAYGPSIKKIILRIKFAGIEIGCHEVELRRPTHPFPLSASTATTIMNVPNETRLEDLDTTDVPRSLHDIVAVQPSTIPNAGNGLFARRDLPARIPLGFFFGVPMTEDEFDSLKEHVGVASQYRIMYQNTVLDGTDDRGNPYRDPSGPIWCPFHFINESSALMLNVELVEGAVANQVIVFTTREIRENEELFASYEGWGRS